MATRFWKFHSRIRPEQLLWSGITLSVVALLLGGLLLYASLRSMAEAHRAAFDVLSLMKGLREVQMTLHQAGDAYDAYAETGDSTLLARYKQAIATLPADLDELRLNAHDPEQQALLAGLIRLTDAHVAMMAENEAAHHATRHQPGVLRRMLANQDAINQTISEFRAFELVRLKRFNDDAAASYRTASWALFTSAVLTTLLLATAAVLFRGELRRRMASEAEAHLLNRTLEKQVAERTEQLAAVARQLEADAVELHDANDRLDQVIRCSPLGIMHFAADLRLSTWNPASESIYGYSAQEMFGLRIDEVARRVGADPDEMQMRARAVLAGEPLSAVTGARRRKDGKPITVRLWGARHSAHTYGREGFVFLVEDVTDRAALEERLLLYEYAFRHASVGIAITAEDGQIRRVNQSLCDLLGYSESDLSALKVADVNQSLAGDVWPAHWADLQQRGAMTLETELQHRDGQLIPVEIEASLLAYQGEQVNLAFIRDLTVRKQIEAQLVQAQKMESIGQLAGGIAHDFNNLLAVIVGNVEIALENTGRDHETSEVLESALRAARRGAELTHQMLAFSRKQPLEPRIVDVRESLAQVKELLSRTLGGTIEFRLELAADLWCCFVDPTQFETTILNLVVNARDAMVNGGRLTIAALNRSLDADYADANPDAHQGDFVCLEVSDTGIGMSKDVLSRVFDPFFSTKPAGKGTGLGMSMVYGFVRQSDGHIKIYSEPGAGTTVRVYLPAVQPVPGATGTKPSAGSHERGGHERLLLVEDDEFVAQVALRQLTQLGYDVVHAGDGPSALEILHRDDDFDLLFTDVVMPGGMSGVELRDAARRLRPDLPVLLTSGFPDVRKADSQIGPDDLFISKPYRRQELNVKIRAALSRRRSAT